MRLIASASSRTFSVLVVAMCLAACGVIPAPYRVDLYQTTWTIETLGSDAGSIGWAIAFNEGGTDAVAVVTTPCGRTQFS